VCQVLINEMPWHRVYIEPFFGTGAVMQMKLPARMNIGIDMDARLIAEAIGFYCDTAVSQYRFVADDALEYLRRYRFVGDEMVFCDPPYLGTTRKFYRHALSEAQHAELLDILVSVPCCVMISGYSSTLYETRLSVWRRISYPNNIFKGQTGETVVWMNYPPPERLHDDSFLGTDHHERQKLKRLYQWITQRVLAFPLLWRQAILVRVLGALSPAERQLIVARVCEELRGVTPDVALQERMPCDTRVTPADSLQSSIRSDVLVTPCHTGCCTAVNRGG
jgi:hypothetical protein